MRKKEFTNEFHAELDTRRAVSTVPPRIMSLAPSSIPELAREPLRGLSSDLTVSMEISTTWYNALLRSVWSSNTGLVVRNDEGKRGRQLGGSEVI